MAAYGLYTHIASNKVRSMLLLGGLFLLVYVMVFAGALLAEVALNSNRPFDAYITLAGRDLIKAFPFATIGAAAWIVIAYFFHQNIIDAVTGGHDVTRQEQPRLYNLLENLCISRGQPMPGLRIVEVSQMNAWASGLSDKGAVITVTRGLLNALNRDELEAVLAHELTHVINRDMRLTVVAAVFAGVITLICELFFRMLRFGGSGGSSRSRSSGGGGGAGALILIAIAAAAVAYILALLVRAAISQKREFLADAGSVELTKNPDAMISALQKISGHADIQAPRDIQAMFIEHPGEGLFASHPPIAKRIEALVKFAAGHDYAAERAAAVASVGTSVPTS